MKDKIPKHSEVWRGRWERMTEKLDAAEDGELVWDRNLNWARCARASVAAALSASVVLAPRGDEELVRRRRRSASSP